MLSNSLGGNAYTRIILNISNAFSNKKETLNTLHFGTRISNLKNKPIKVKEYSISELKADLEKTIVTLAQTQAIVRQKEEEQDKMKRMLFEAMNMLTPNQKILLDKKMGNNISKSIKKNNNRN